jgi:hypothetical protein
MAEKTFVRIYSMRRLAFFIFLVVSANTFFARAQGQQQNAAASGFTIAFPAPLADETKWYAQMPDNYQALFQQAFDRVQAIWATEEFKRRVLATRFHHYRHNDDRDPNVVFTKVTAAHPKQLIYYLCAYDDNAYATTDQSDGKTCVFKSYMEGEGKSANALVNTLSHEFTHTRDGGLYMHPVSGSRLLGGGGREMTVPYAVGNITEDIASAMYPEQAARKVKGAEGSVEPSMSPTPVQAPVGHHVVEDIVITKRSAKKK